MQTLLKKRVIKVEMTSASAAGLKFETPHPKEQGEPLLNA
jgi:hypothetical protein